MILVILLICLLIAALNMTLFQVSVWLSLGTIVFCVAGAVIQLCRKRLPRGLVYGLSALCLFVVVLLLWNGGKRIQSGGILDYEKSLVKVYELLDDGKLDKAVEELSLMEETYGSDDNTHILMALENLLKKNYENAYSEMDRVEDRSSRIYYAVMEGIYISDPSGESVDRIYQLYREAAEDWPNWTYMQKYAGIAEFEQKNYGAAEYFLLRAYRQNETDYRTVYYLGAVSYYQGNRTQSQQYFNEAVKLGADEETCSNILWYVRQMEGGDGAE